MAYIFRVKKKPPHSKFTIVNEHKEVTIEMFTKMFVKVKNWQELKCPTAEN